MARPERFELPTLCFEGRCSIQLSYGRAVEVGLILKHLLPFPKTKSSSFSLYCVRTVPESQVDGRILAQVDCHFVGLAIEFLQSFSLHLQLHLRVLLEDLRITLAKHLGDPFVSYATSA